MKRQILLTILFVFALALVAGASDQATFEFATTLDSAQAMSGGEKPILLDFYTDW